MKFSFHCTNFYRTHNRWTARCVNILQPDVLTSVKRVWKLRTYIRLGRKLSGTAPVLATPTLARPLSLTNRVLHSDSQFNRRCQGHRQTDRQTDRWTWKSYTDFLNIHFCYFANDAGTDTGNVRRTDIKTKINARTKTIVRKQSFLQNFHTVAEGKGIAKHSLGTLDRRAAAAAEMTVSPITEFQDISCLTAVRIGGSHARTSVDKHKRLHATEQWGYDYT
jgi:hypothetical protein